MKKALAIDMGATSIRGILGWVCNGKLETEEVMRLEHRLVEKDGRVRWQWEKLISCIEDTILQYAGQIDSVGVDTWGVDFGVLDEKGTLVSDPISYRDPQHVCGYEKALKMLGGRKLFLETGTQLMPINTLFQLITLQELCPYEWEKADRLLMMPDLVSYMLCGSAVAEETILSTAQVMDLKSIRLDDALLECFGICSDLFAPMVQAGTKLGTTVSAKSEKLCAADPVDVIAVCGHDTASAVLLTEAFQDPECLFLSCGTWSLFGALSNQAFLSELAYECAMTNELSYGQHTMFFKNVTGLYLLEKLKEELEEEEGRKIGFEEITAYVLAHPNRSGCIDMDAPQFAKAHVQARSEISVYLKKQGRELPTRAFDYFRIVYESLVEKYVETRMSIEKITKKKYKALHMIGGGSKSELLCQMTADHLCIPVIAGPSEATAYGNLIIQLIAEKEIADIAEGLALVKEAARAKTYLPHCLEL